MSLRHYLRRSHWDEERVREMDAHISQEISDNVARGLTPAEARRPAHIKFGNPTVIREEIWQMNSFVLIENLGRDVRYAVRQLLRSPGFPNYEKSPPTHSARTFADSKRHVRLSSDIRLPLRCALLTEANSDD
jgi:hypothetical protein